MPSNQWESRIVVIEGNIGPLRRLMAGPAVGAKLTVVVILAGMTGIAIRGRSLKTIGMAGCTGNTRM